MNSFFLSKINQFLSLTQAKLSFVSKNSFILKNIDFLIMTFAFLALVFSLFTSSQTLGLLVLIAFGLLVMKYIFCLGAKIEVDIFDVLVCLYVAIFCIAAVFSSWFIFSLHGLIKVFIYFFSYLIFKDIFKQRSDNKVIFLTLLAVLVSIESVIAILQQVFGVEMLATWQDMKSIRSDQVMNRVYGTLKPLNPNLLGGYLVAAMPAVLGGVFFDFKKVKFNLVAFTCLFLTLLAIIFTGCRGAYVSVFIQGLLFIAISGHIIWNDFADRKALRKIWWGSILIALLSILGLICASPALQHRVTSIFLARADSSNSFRFNVYASSIRMFFDNWFFGIGVGNWTFREVYGCYMLTGYDALGAYSVPLEIAVESGIFGLLNFIVMILMSFIVSAKKILSAISYNQKVLVSVCFLSIVGMVVHGIVDTVWFRPQIQFIFWMMLAILSSNELNKEMV